MTLTYQVATQLTPLVAKTVEILQREVQLRRGLSLEKRSSQADIVLDIQAGIGLEGFRIEQNGGQTRIVGNDERGLLYGVGKFLRDRSWRGTSVPEKPVRGMYFATHFHNFYHDAPIEAVNRYVEELALWGCNTLSVWFDMHHYSGIDEPPAQQLIARLRAILQAANAVGMGAALTSLANEAYNTSPRELRAAPFPHHYRLEICPSKPAGLDLIVRWREEMLAQFSDLNIEHFWIWPYDQGGCRCNDCKPWGANGFLRNAEAVAKVVRRLLPRAKTIISTWEFGYYEGDAEWDGFYAAMAKRPEWADMVMAEHHGDYPKYVLQHGAPGNLPLLNFPEISMFNMAPWGGFGANPAPERFQKIWNECGRLLSGGYPYSEGIYEDINKVIALRFYWDSHVKAKDVVREYVAYEFSESAADELTTAACLMETVEQGDADRDEVRQRAVGKSITGKPAYALRKTENVVRCWQIVQKAQSQVASALRGAWRWRIFAVRAELDAELVRTHGEPSDLTERLLAELEQIYCAGEAEWQVMPPAVAPFRRRKVEDWADKLPK